MPLLRRGPWFLHLNMKVLTEREKLLLYKILTNGVSIFTIHYDLIIVYLPLKTTDYTADARFLLYITHCCLNACDCVTGCKKNYIFSWQEFLNRKQVYWKNMMRNYDLLYS